MTLVSQPILVPRDTPPQMDKVPSIFAISMKSESSSVAMPTEDNDEEEPMEIDELDTAICDNLVVRVVKSISMYCYDNVVCM